MNRKLAFQKLLKTTLIKLRLFNFVSKTQNKTFKFLKGGYTPKDFWNKWSDSYFHQPSRTKFDTAHEWLKRQLRTSAPRSVLEVGCGFGRNLKFVSEESGLPVRLYGMDISEEMLKKAAAFTARIPRLHLSAGDIGCLPFKDNSFDLVFTYGTLMHVPPAKCPHAFSELLRVSKKGVIIIEEILIANGDHTPGRRINDYTFIHNYADVLKGLTMNVIDKQQHTGLVDLLCLHCEKKK